ncbi:hypothetical protein GNF85_25190, partial [Clostridium perfringens]
MTRYLSIAKSDKEAVSEDLISLSRNGLSAYYLAHSLIISLQHLANTPVSIVVHDNLRHLERMMSMNKQWKKQAATLMGAAIAVSGGAAAYA